MQKQEKKEMMWAFMIKFGSNMWGKKYDLRDPEIYTEAHYHDTMFTDKETFYKVIDFLPECGINTLLIDMGEGLKMDSHPELAVPGSWEKNEFREALSYIRSLGITPIPKLNFSAGHNAWLQEYGMMIGTEPYYKVCQDLIEEMIEVYDTPEFFHLGLDEELYYEGADEAAVQIVRAPFKFVEDAKKLFDICINKGVRPWIWADVTVVDNYGGEEGFKANVPKEVLVSNSYYYNFVTRSKSQKRCIELYKQLGEWGYQQLPCCSTWDNAWNIKQTLGYCKKEVKQESIAGYLSAPWLHTISDNYYGLLHGAWKLAVAKKDLY